MQQAGHRFTPARAQLHPLALCRRTGPAFRKHRRPRCSFKPQLIHPAGLGSQFAQLFHRRNTSAAQQGRPVAQAFHFLKDMAGQKDRHTLLFFRQKNFPQLVLHQRIQAAGGFIQNQQPGTVHQRAHQPHLLFGSLGHFSNLLIRIQPEPGAQLQGMGKITLPPQPRHQPDKGHAGHIVHQRQFSGQIPHLSLYPGCLCKTVFSENTGAAAVRPDETHQLADGCGLARAIRPQKAKRFALLHLKIQPEHTPTPAVISGQIADCDHRFAH